MRVDDDVDVGLAALLGLGSVIIHRIQQATTGLSNTATGRASAASVVASLAATLVVITAFSAAHRHIVLILGRPELIVFLLHVLSASALVEQFVIDRIRLLPRHAHNATSRLELIRTH